MRNRVPRCTSILYRAITVVLLFALPSFGYSQVLSLSSDRIETNLGQYVEVAINQDSRLNPLLASRALMTPLDADAIGLDTSLQPAWLRLTVRNDDSETHEWVLASMRTTAQVLEIYRVGDDQAELLFDSANLEQRRKSLARYFNMVAPLILAPGEETTIVVRYKSANAGWLPLRIVPSSLAPTQMFSYLFLKLVSAAGALALILYNLVLFAVVRRPIYGLYALAASSLVLLSLHIHFPVTAQWIAHIEGLNRTVNAVLVSLSGFFILLFASRFLDISREGRMYLWQRRVQALLLLSLGAAVLMRMIYPPLGDAAALLCWLISAMVYSALPFVLYFRAREQVAEMWLLGTAWILVAMQLWVLILYSSGWVPASAINLQLLGPAVFIEALLIAVSVVMRVRSIQAEKEHADANRHLALQEMAQRAQLVLASSHDATNFDTWRAKFESPTAK